MKAEGSVRTSPGTAAGAVLGPGTARGIVGGSESVTRRVCTATPRDSWVRQVFVEGRMMVEGFGVVSGLSAKHKDQNYIPICDGRYGNLPYVLG